MADTRPPLPRSSPAPWSSPTRRTPTSASGGSSASSRTNSEEPITAVENFEERLAIALEGVDYDVDDPAVAVASAIALYLAEHPNRVDGSAAPGDVVDRAVLAQWHGDPPEAVRAGWRAADRGGAHGRRRRHRRRDDRRGVAGDRRPHPAERGVPERYDGRPVLEVAHATLVVARPDADDPLIAEHGDPERLAWMRANFADHARVRRARRRALLRQPDLRLRGVRSRSARLGGRPAARRPGLAQRDDHDVRAADRHHLHPVRVDARLLGPRRRDRVGGLRPLDRLRRQGLRQPDRARPASAPGRGRARAPGRRAAVHRQSAHVYDTERDFMARVLAAR